MNARDARAGRGFFCWRCALRRAFRRAWRTVDRIWDDEPPAALQWSLFAILLFAMGYVLSKR